MLSVIVEAPGVRGLERTLDRPEILVGTTDDADLRLPKDLGLGDYSLQILHRCVAIGGGVFENGNSKPMRFCDLEVGRPVHLTPRGNVTLTVVERKDPEETRRFDEQIQQLRAQLEGRERELATVRDHAENARRRCTELEAKFANFDPKAQDNARRALETARAELAEVKQELERTRADRDLARTDIETLRQRFLIEGDERLRELEKTRANLDRLGKLELSWKTVNADLDAKRAAAAEEASRLRSRCDELEGRLASVDPESYASIERELQTVRSGFEASQEELAAARDETEKERLRYRDLVARESALIEKLKNKDRDIEREREGRASKIAGLEEREKSLRENNRSLLQEKHEFERKIADLEQEIRDLEAKLEEANWNVTSPGPTAATETKIEELTNEVDRLRLELQDERSVVRSRATEIEGLSGQLKALRSSGETEKLRKELAARAVEGERLRAGLAAADGELATVRAELEQIRKTGDLSRADVIRKLLDDQAREQGRFKSEKAELQRKLEDAVSRIRQLENSAPSVGEGAGWERNRVICKELVHYVSHIGKKIEEYRELEIAEFIRLAGKTVEEGRFRSITSPALRGVVDSLERFTSPSPDDVRLIDGIRDGLRRLRDEHWLAVKTASQLALLKLRIDPLFQKLKPSVILARCRVAEDTTARAHEFRNLWERYKQSFESVSVDLAKMFDDIRRTGETGETGELGQLG